MKQAKDNFQTQNTLKENHVNTKNINFQFHYRKSTKVFHTFLLTEGEGEVSLALSKNWEKVP